MPGDARGAGAPRPQQRPRAIGGVGKQLRGSKPCAARGSRSPGPVQRRASRRPGSSPAVLCRVAKRKRLGRQQERQGKGQTRQKMPSQRKQQNLSKIGTCFRHCLPLHLITRLRHQPSSSAAAGVLTSEASTAATSTAPTASPTVVTSAALTAAGKVLRNRRPVLGVLGAAGTVPDREIEGEVRLGVAVVHVVVAHGVQRASWPPPPQARQAGRRLERGDEGGDLVASVPACACVWMGVCGCGCVCVCVWGARSGHQRAAQAGRGRVPLPVGAAAGARRTRGSEGHPHLCG
jgi:hypothetical protein